jgi:hypothetical protein
LIRDSSRTQRVIKDATQSAAKVFTPEQALLDKAMSLLTERAQRGMKKR